MRRSQAQWEQYCTGGMPADIAAAVLQDARALYQTFEPASSSPFYRMNQRLVDHRKGFRATNLHRAFDAQAIRDHATNAAHVARRIEPASNQLSDQLRALERREHLAHSMGVQPPCDRNYTICGRLKRLETAKWWRRQFRKVWTRDSEGRCRRIGLVRKGRQCYVTDAAVRNRVAMGVMCVLYLQSHEVVNELDEHLLLWDVAKGSMANLEIRRGELMTRARGFEEVARSLGHQALFITLTAPSAFHPQLAAGGSNPNYQQYSVRDAQRWLSKMWARTRARLKRSGVLVYGFRMAEPHHDGTPHWHVLLHGRTEALDATRRALEYHWLSEFSDEPGATQHRVKFETIDPAKGSAVGYIAKYISKNIDGSGQIGAQADAETDTGEITVRGPDDDIRANCLRVRAWASIHGLRQFQQIGGPPVGIWREARRLREGVRDLDLRAVVEAADRGDWCGFIRNVGGIHAGRKTNVRLKKEDTGASNIYDEFAPSKVVGLQYASTFELTRPHKWRLQKCQSPLSLSVPPPAVLWSDFSSVDAWASETDTTHAEQISALSRFSTYVKPPPPPPSPQQLESEYFSDSGSGSRSTLGPVVITVRGLRYILARHPELGVLGWVPEHRFVEFADDSS